MDIIYIQRPKVAFATCGQVGDTKIAKHCGVWRELMRVRLPPSGAAMSKDAKTHSAITPWRRGQHDDESN